MKTFYMKMLATLLLVPLILFSSSCVSHHGGHYRHGHHGYPSGHVSVHGGHHGDVLGALIIGGIIGHVITQTANEAEHKQQTNTQQRNNQPASEAGVSTNVKQKNEHVAEENSEQKREPVAEQNSEQSREQDRFYQLGKDDNCYLMQKQGQQVLVIVKVPSYPCSE